jgi:hypothetical protein
METGALERRSYCQLFRNYRENVVLGNVRLVLKT